MTDALSNLIISPNGDQLFYLSTAGIVKTIKKIGGSWTSSSNFLIYDGSSYSTITGVKDRTLTVSPDPSNLQLYFVAGDDIPRIVYSDGYNYRVGYFTSNLRVKKDFKLIRIGETPPTQTHFSFTGYDNLIHTLRWESPCNVIQECGRTGYNPILLKKTKTDINISLNNTKLEEIIISPNPTTGIFNISGAANLQLNKITINSMLGQKVFEQAINNNNDVIEINITNLPNGIYICQLYSSLKVNKIIKLIKNG